MAKLKFIKDIVNDQVISSFQLIVNSIFGGKLPDIYNENNIYNKGDYVIVIENGKHVIKHVTVDGVTGPFDPENFKEVVFTEIIQDTNVLVQNITEIKVVQEAVTDDLATLVYELAGMLDNRLSMNILYRENFKTPDHITINNGIFSPGFIQSVPNKGIDFQLASPIELNTKPAKFKLKHYTEIQGIPTLGCFITFNALDSNPAWFNVSEALLSSSFFDIPSFEKEDGKPYALNIRIHGNSAYESNIKISDLMVVFL